MSLNRKKLLEEAKQLEELLRLPKCSIAGTAHVWGYVHPQSKFFEWNYLPEGKVTQMCDDLKKLSKQGVVKFSEVLALLSRSL